MLVTTHYIEEADILCDRVAISGFIFYTGMMKRPSSRRARSPS